MCKYTGLNEDAEMTSISMEGQMKKLQSNLLHRAARTVNITQEKHITPSICWSGNVPFSGTWMDGYLYYKIGKIPLKLCTFLALLPGSKLPP